MIILGLGTNEGDCLHNLRLAINKIKQATSVNVINISPVYFSDALLKENAPAAWNKPFFNCAIAISTDLEPYALLKILKSIEQAMGRNSQAPRWSPRIIDIDILAYDNLVLDDPHLKLPHPELINRPFALWPFADIHPLWRSPMPGEMHGKTAAELVEKWGSRFSGDAPCKTKQIYQRIPTPQLVGIINVTPDSFSDGDPSLTIDSVIQQAIALVEAGAEILDIGAESTSPTATAIDSKTEWQRLEPVLNALQQTSFFLTPKISIDTRHPEIAEAALSFGVHWINDVTGLDDPAMRAIVRTANIDCVVMHHKRVPERRNDVLSRHENPIIPVLAWAKKRIDELITGGISREHIIFDPGIGFGKMAEQSLLVLQQLSVFDQLGVRILIGHSRKTFLSLFTDATFAERDIETIALSQYLASQPITYLRVHNVAASARVLRVHEALNQTVP